MTIKHILVFLGILLFSPVWAGRPVPVELPEIDHNFATFEVVGPGRAPTVFAPADLETLPTYRLETTTPWRESPAQFDGVLLPDILRATGLDTAPAIRVTAENDYVTMIPRAVWEGVPILVSTRVDGAPHTRRARGPIQFIIPAETLATSPLAREEYMVWMVRRIEAAQ